MDYEKILSQTVQEIKPSGIRKFFDLLGDMQDVIALTVGQPDFVTPWHIRVSAIESLEKGKTYYTSNSGTLELRTEISNYMNRRYGLNYDPLKEIPGLGRAHNPYPVSKGVISLRNDRGTSFDMYLQVQNELTAAIKEMRDELSLECFGKKAADVTDEQRDALEMAIPMAISEAEPTKIGGGK